MNIKEKYVNKRNIVESKKFSLSKEIRVECKMNQKEIKGGFNKCFCYSCLINNGNKHNIIQFNRYDDLCKIHFNFFSHYYYNCKKLFVFIVNLNIN